MIIINNEALLRTPCADVDASEVGDLRRLLEAELANSARLGRPGIGLAAPQIGIFKKMAIIRLGHADLDLDLVNAHVEKGYDETIHRDEGCLSFPGRVENVIRFQEVYIKGNLVQPESMILTGLMAICAQHELDHINGILLPDRALAKPKPILAGPRPGPNQPCLCGSGKKYKKCCYK